MRRRLPALAVLLGLFAMHAVANDCPPAFLSARYDEDYSCLREHNASGQLEAIKAVSLPLDLNASLGGEARLRYDYQHNPTWGQDPQDEHGAFLQRYLLHADVRDDDGDFRVFAQLRSALADGRKVSPSPIEEGHLEVQQAFADVALLRGDTTNTTLRLGRQEVRFGSERLVSFREGPNVRRRFDGLRALTHFGTSKLDAFALHLTENEPGYFEDGTNRDESLWGIYATVPDAIATGAGIDLYYLGFRNREATYAAGFGRETRHTVGTRLWGARKRWDWNWEAIYQFGRFDEGDIRAWSIATDTGYTLSAMTWSPRVGINANVATGDRDADDDSLETFNPLFPRGPYFDELSLLGPRNFFNVHPSVALHPRDDLTLTADVDFYWRLERDDGVYDPAGNLLRDGTGSDARYVSTLFSATSAWQTGRNLELTFVYTHVFPGEFIRETGPHSPIDFIELTARVQF
jgi:hypothetical protein